MPVAPADEELAGQDTGRGALLVLGAGEDQLPVYVEAKRRGMQTIAVDSSTDRPALRYADERLHISTRDHMAIAAALGRRRLAGVVSAASDASLESWHELSNRYRAPFRYPLTAAIASIDKIAFHAVADAAGVTAYRWRQHTDPRALVELAPEVGFPLVAKPADSSGSKGVTLVRRPEDLPAALDYAAEFTMSGTLVIEEFLAGSNLTVDVFMRDGEAAFAGITEKRILPGVHFVIGGHTCPAPIDSQLHQRLTGLAARLCRAVGLDDGPANFDVIVAGDGEIRVLEANARLCGNAFPLLMREVYGVDTVAALTSLALGAPFELTPTRRQAGIIHVLASPLDVDGVLAGISGLAEARAIPGVARCEVYAEPGAVVRPFVQSGRKFGYILVTGPDIGSAESTLAEALRTLQIDVTPAGAHAVTAAPRVVADRQHLPHASRVPAQNPHHRTVVEGAAHER
jgi:biotin carboxylase